MTRTARLLALLSFLRLARAHPGAVADGRATCGTEYSTASTAYTVPDVREAWYLRRVATCNSPAFWVEFDIAEEGQEVYIATISPTIERFEDEMQFHAIWYGPGLGPDEENGLLEIPEVLPEGVELDEALAAEGAAYMTNAVFDSCDFVDTNNVMKNWSDLVNGRCSETFAFADDFSDPLQQGATDVVSWWLYSFNHRAAKRGTYRLQSWLTGRDDETTAQQGKFEITLGPHSWSGYASDGTLALAQSQGTSCSCAVNAWDYKETYLERMGDLPEEFGAAQLPGGSCAGDESPASSCVTIPREEYLTDGSAVEWSGLFELEAGREYEWTFRAYYQGTDADPEYGYPDPGMFVYMVAADDVESVAAEANDILTATVESEEGDPSTIVAEGDTLQIDTPTFIEFTDTKKEVSTTVLIEPDSDSSVALFTQHVPSEFMAIALRDKKTGEYVFPTLQTLYSDAGGATSEEVATTSAPTDATTMVTAVGSTSTSATDASVETAPASSSATTTSATNAPATTNSATVTTSNAATTVTTFPDSTTATSNLLSTVAPVYSATTPATSSTGTTTAAPNVARDTASASSIQFADTLWIAAIVGVALLLPIL